MNKKKTIIKKVSIKRPTFYLDTDKTQELRAGGVIFYRYNTMISDYELLMMYTRNNYEDFGGCTDDNDNDIFDTIAREVSEESNNIFTFDFIRNKIKDMVPVYIKHCKYALYFIELEDYYDPADFGDKEIHDNIERKVEWIQYDKFSDKDFLNKLNFRLKSYNVINYLNKLMDENISFID